MSGPHRVCYASCEWLLVDGRRLEMLYDTQGNEETGTHDSGAWEQERKVARRFERESYQVCGCVSIQGKGKKQT